MMSVRSRPSVFLFALCALTAADAPAAEPSQADADTAGSMAQSVVNVGDSGRLARAFDKARRGEAITLGYLGGSITQGYAASRDANRYASRITAWWQQQFPTAKVAAVNAGIGGTGSDYGALRVKQDLLSKNPDVVFVEFAVNDGDNEHSARTLEGVVRQVLGAPVSPACVLLFMSHNGRNAQRWHAQVGKHYDLPMVSYRDGLAVEIAAGRLKWADISPDDIHPNDRGHAMAARYVTALLDTHAARPPAPQPATAALPAPRFTDLYANVDSRDAADLRPTRADGWAYDAATKSWKADRPGSVIEFETSGRGVALMYYRVHKDFGRARVTVDGAHEQTFDGWFDQTWGGYRHTSDVATDLPPGRHAVRVELLNEKAEKSRGHEFRIMGLAALGVATP